MHLWGQFVVKFNKTMVTVKRLNNKNEQKGKLKAFSIKKQLSLYLRK